MRFRNTQLQTIKGTKVGNMRESYDVPGAKSQLTVEENKFGLDQYMEARRARIEAARSQIPKYQKEM